VMDSIAEWLVAQISISTAYAEETPSATITDYVFRVTTTDPNGLQATSQVTTQVSTPATTTSQAKGMMGTMDGGTVTSTLPEIKIVGVELLTPTQTEEIKTTGATVTPITPLNVGETTGVGTQAFAPPAVVAEGGIVETGGGVHAYATEGGCSLTRDTASSTMDWLWILPLLALIPMRTTCCQTSPRRPSRCRSAPWLRR
jgi:hypothetical protein